MEIQKISLNDPCFGQKLLHSFRQTGFAILTDHKVNLEQLKEFYVEWQEFFNSEMRKKVYLYGADHSGFFPMDSEKAKDATIADLKEFFHYYPSIVQDPMIGLSGDIFDMLNSTAVSVLIELELALPKEVRDVYSEPLSSMITGSKKTLLRILHYPPVEDVPQGAVRAAEHEDINLITILPGATEMGLEVKAADGTWIPVKAGTDDLVVNVGDMLQEATKGYLKSTPHRVVNVGMNKSRLSAPLFLHPRPDVVLSEKYTAGSYLQERLEQLGLA